MADGDFKFWAEAQKAKGKTKDEIGAEIDELTKDLPRHPYNETGGVWIDMRGFPWRRLAELDAKTW